MFQDLLGAKSPTAHYGSANLAHSHSMPPTGSMQKKLRRKVLPIFKDLFNNKCRAIQMAFRQPLSDFKFFAHNNTLLFAHYFQADNPSRPATFDWFKVEYYPKNRSDSGQSTQQLVLFVSNRPAEKIGRCRSKSIST